MTLTLLDELTEDTWIRQSRMCRPGNSQYRERLLRRHGWLCYDRPECHQHQGWWAGEDLRNRRSSGTAGIHSLRCAHDRTDPAAALVGVMFMVVIGTFEWSSFRVMKSIPRSDALVIVVVSVITVVTNLAIAVAVGSDILRIGLCLGKGQEDGSLSVYRSVWFEDLSIGRSTVLWVCPIFQRAV